MINKKINNIIDVVNQDLSTGCVTFVFQNHSNGVKKNWNN